MASSVRSPLIAAELGYGGDGRVASRDLWIPWDILPRNCLVYRYPVLEYLEDLARNQSLSPFPGEIPNEIAFLKYSEDTVINKEER